MAASCPSLGRCCLILGGRGVHKYLEVVDFIYQRGDLSFKQSGGQLIFFSDLYFQIDPHYLIYKLFVNILDLGIFFHCV